MSSWHHQVVAVHQCLVLLASQWQRRSLINTERAASDEYDKALVTETSNPSEIQRRTVTICGAVFLASSAMVGVLALLWNADDVRDCLTVLPTHPGGSPSSWLVCGVARAAAASALLFALSVQLYRHCLCIKPSRELRKSAFTDARQRAATYPPPYPVSMQAPPIHAFSIGRNLYPTSQATSLVDSLYI